jgi:hypothetical protein
MAAKLKVIKTQNEFNILTSEQTLGKKTAVVCFFNGADAGWKAKQVELNDLAGDFFERGSFIGVDARFFQAISDKYHAAAGQAAVFTLNGNVTVVELTSAAIRAAVKT